MGGRPVGGRRWLSTLEAPAAPLLSFTPQVAAGAPWDSLLARRKGAAAAAALAGVGAGSGGASPCGKAPPAASRRPGAAGPDGEPAGRLGVRGGGRRSRAADRADVLFLQELTDEAVRPAPAGRAERLAPARDARLGAGEGLRDSGIYSRFPLASGLITPVPSPIRGPIGAADRAVCGAWSACTCIPPTADRGTAERRQVAGGACHPAATSRSPRVLAGDFNATPIMRSSGGCCGWATSTPPTRRATGSSPHGGPGANPRSSRSKQYVVVST